MLVAFTDVKDISYAGTYGVSENDPSAIELTIHEDHTFSYQDFSNANKQIKTSGTWTNHKNTIELKSNSPEIKFHSKWKIVDGGESAKSRMGLTFYTLRKK